MPFDPKTTPAVGTPLAGDTVDATWHPHSKMVFGGPDEARPVTDDDGLPVALSAADKAKLDQIAADTAGPAAVGAYARRELLASTTADEIADANPTRKFLSFTNNSATIAVWVSEGSAAVVGTEGQRVLPGGSYLADTQDFVSVVAESGTAHCFGIEG